MGNPRIWLASLIGFLWVQVEGGLPLGAQTPTAPDPVPQTIYRLPESGSSAAAPEETPTPAASDPTVQQTDPQATFTRTAPAVDQTNNATDSDPDADPSDHLSESAPVFQLDVRLQEENSGAGQGTSRSGSGQADQGGESGSGGVPGIFGGEGSVPGQGASGQGSTGSGAPGSGTNGTGSGIGRSEAVSARRAPETTGLIVDARGLDFQPSMSMRLFDPEGNQVYTTPSANQDLNAYLVASSGTAAYVSSEEQARSLVQRIGERPFQIEAIKTLGYDLVISNEDAWALRQRNQVDQFLDNYAVVVIWGDS